jgi:hypothetical protein
MSVTTNALVFHLPLSFVQLQTFMMEHAINHTVVSDMDTDTLPMIIPNKEIISVLSDPVNINMFHMMMEMDAMSYDDIKETGDISDIDYDAIDITDFIDMEFGMDVMDTM